MPERDGVLVLGGAGVDHVVQVPQLPLPLADSIHSTVHTRAGQTGDFVALGLHALGLPTTHLDVIGDDPEGNLVRELHDRQGIPFHSIITPQGTKRSVNLVDPHGRRLSLYDSSRGAGGVTFPPDLLATLAGRARHAHVSITEPCAEAIPALAAAGLTISTDLHDWDGADDYHRAFAERADIVFLSTANLTDPEAAMRSLAGPRVVVAMAGAQGGYVLADDRIRPYGPATPPGEVRDTNGAGDAFVAGFLLGRLTGEPLDRCLRFGAIAGAHACTVPATRVDPIDRATLTGRL
ncbi:adenosine kinase [Actinoplanes sp. LDG1-01]|uniref:Adenosine kinase n=1 Tax=Paractinoplanes lichenicola TaxID=2802976 RepID=A0ABS1VMB1_9ACTN|nr:adenosine kinase [Actinoplanes lichenicola]